MQSRQLLTYSSVALDARRTWNGSRIGLLDEKFLTFGVSMWKDCYCANLCLTDEVLVSFLLSSRGLYCEVGMLDVSLLLRKYTLFSPPRSARLGEELLDKPSILEALEKGVKTCIRLSNVLFEGFAQRSALIEEKLIFQEGFNPSYINTWDTQVFSSTSKHLYYLLLRSSTNADCYSFILAHKTSLIYRLLENQSRPILFATTWF